LRKQIVGVSVGVYISATSDFYTNSLDSNAATVFDFENDGMRMRVSRGGIDIEEGGRDREI
jgi:hypothetical protein